MALFKRMKSPRDQRHVTTTATPAAVPVSEEKVKEAKKKSLSGHRRHKSDDQIVVAIDSAIFDEEVPPELPPRNRSDSSGAGSFSFGTAYRRTQSSGTMSTSFKASGHAARRPQEDYFVPADTIRQITSRRSGSSSSVSPSSKPPSLQDRRIMNMHDKIMTHNDPDFQASQKPRSRSFEKLVDVSDYSVPFDVLQDHEKKLVPPPKPPTKRASHKMKVSETVEASGLTSAPDYLPPPPPLDEKDEGCIEEERPQSSSPHSPSVSVSNAGGDYDDPWDSTKFRLIRPRADTEPPLKNIPSSGGHHSHFDPYKSPMGSHSELSETEPPLPPKLTTDSSAHTTPNHDSSHFTSSPTPPPVPDSSRPVSDGLRPRASTGESDYCEPPESPVNHDERHKSGSSGYYVNHSPLHERVVNGEGGYMHDYVNQPACPPKLPPRPKKQHCYPQLVPPDIHVSSHSPDIQSLPPPAFPIDTSHPLEEQLWYHGKIGRDQAEDILRNQPDFSFLVRNSESCRMDYSLSIRDRTSPAAHGFIHLKISNGPKGYVLGQFSCPFRSVPECIAFYTQQPLTIKNINHRRLGFPVGRIQFTH